MTSLIDMISAFIALLVSAAFLHFGAAGDAVSRAEPPTVERQANQPPTPVQPEKGAGHEDADKRD